MRVDPAGPSWMLEEYGWPMTSTGSIFRSRRIMTKGRCSARATVSLLHVGRGGDDLVLNAQYDVTGDCTPARRVRVRLHSADQYAAQTFLQIKLGMLAFVDKRERQAAIGRYRCFRQKRAGTNGFATRLPTPIRFRTNWCTTPSASRCAPPQCASARRSYRQSKMKI